MLLLNGTSRVESALVIQCRVIYAVMLRDIRTRFFGHGLGYLIAIGWPLSHILILLIIYGVTGRTTPYGSSLALFFGAGLVPFMTFNYMSRFTMLSLMINRPLTQLPAVKTFDLMIARVILEALAACCMTAVLCLLFYIGGIDLTPRDPAEAAAAFGAALLLGAGFGCFNAILAVAIPGWVTGYVLLQITMYMASGIAFTPDQMPKGLRDILAWNPIFHGVEWMRMAYFEGYEAVALDKTYFIGWGLVSLFLALVVERVFRGRLLLGG